MVEFTLVFRVFTQEGCRLAQDGLWFPIPHRRSVTVSRKDTWQERDLQGVRSPRSRCLDQVLKAPYKRKQKTVFGRKEGKRICLCECKSSWWWYRSWLPPPRGASSPFNICNNPPLIILSWLDLPLASPSQGANAHLMCVCALFPRARSKPLIYPPPHAYNHT